MDKCEPKRKKGGNYSPEEKSTLLEIIQTYKNIIDNKKTDGVNVKEKAKAWRNISDSFNQIYPEKRRDKESLKICYQNLKKRCRSAISLCRTEWIKTEGPCEFQLPLPIDEKVAELVHPITQAAIRNVNNYDPILFDSEKPSVDTEVEPSKDDCTLKTTVDTCPLKRKSSTNELTELAISQAHEVHQKNMAKLDLEIKFMREKHKLEMEILQLKKKKLME